MIRFTQGNLLEAPVEAVVNTVNELGVMGKGIALLFKDHFPESAKAYMRAAARKEIQVGTMFVTATSDLLGPRWVIHFPTKRHWRHRSKLEWILSGLKDLRRVIRENGIQSLAIPPLGCGNGGLDWHIVRSAIEDELGDLEGVNVLVYEPTNRYYGKPKRSGVSELTPARALVAELIRRYGILGFDCSLLEVQKLAWFLKRGIDQLGVADPLRLRFQPNRYGPYADEVRHLLDAMDGTYLHCKRRIADAPPLEPIWFEPDRRDEVALFLSSDEARQYAPALEWTAALIDGFESPLGMELLATVDWLLWNQRVSPTVLAVKSGISKWPADSKAVERKQRILDDRMLALALERLGEADSVPPPTSATSSKP